MRIIIFTLLVLAQSTAAWACGANPTIASAAVKGVTPVEKLNQYQLGITVVNSGGAAQPTNTLQFIDMYDAKTGAKLDAKGIPPLKAGESYSVVFPFQRSTDAGNGTTKLNFQLAMEQPYCNTDNVRQTVTF